MRARRPARPIAAWIATLAVLLAALAPALSHAWAADRLTGALIEVCTTEGSQWLPAEDGAPLHAAHALEHCPYCSLQSDMPAVPPPTAAPWPLVRSAAALPAEDGATVIPTQPRAKAQARAPPGVR